MYFVDVQLKSSVLTSLNLIPDTVNHREDCGTVRCRKNWMSVLLLCRFRASVVAWQHHQLLWRTARYSIPGILFMLLPHTALFAMLGFCFCQICTPCVWHSLLTYVTFILLVSTSSFMSNLCYIVWYFCSLKVLFCVPVYYHQPALNFDEVINVNLTLSVLLALCVSRMSFYRCCSLYIWIVYAFLWGTVTCVSV